ncbi:MAG: Fe-S cluster assembly protein NifU [Elusimicrobiaceae bacterium]|nr:Fe-S cluster assembly protein NifU [Elusimicrobiaceae bacterium]
MWDYTDKVMDHFKKPRNVGSIENADGTGQVGSLICGDALKLTIKVNKETEIIEDIKFQTFGCASAIASSSVLTEMAKGKTLAEASKITNQDIANALGSLPEAKMHCSVMGMEALEAAIKSYRQGGKPVVFEQTQESKVICHCFNITEETILKAVHANNLKTVEDVTHFTKAGGACGKCKAEIQKILDKVLACEIPQKQEGKKAFSSLTIVEKIKAIENVLNTEIKPQLNQDGGSIELVDLQGNTVIVRLLGGCASCIASQMTLKNFVGKTLQEKLDKNLEVKQA